MPTNPVRDRKTCIFSSLSDNISNGDGIRAPTSARNSTCISMITSSRRAKIVERFSYGFHVRSRVKFSFRFTPPPVSCFRVRFKNILVTLARERIYPSPVTFTITSTNSREIIPRRPARRPRAASREVGVNVVESPQPPHEEEEIVLGVYTTLVGRAGKRRFPVRFSPEMCISQHRRVGRLRRNTPGTFRILRTFRNVTRFGNPSVSLGSGARTTVCVYVVVDVLTSTIRVTRQTNEFASGLSPPPPPSPPNRIIQRRR